jgi:DNA-directed RNA polymerase specialized sigma24 family protein
MNSINTIEIDTPKNRELALRNIFETKYAWLLRWALHFTEDNRSAAEDLVQETFVRLMLTWDTLVNFDDLEPLLYTYLRYAYLTERRRGRGHAFQSLSSVDFDTLAISLHTTIAFDQIAVQNEIRDILAYLLWRRRSARFASMFILRFFHGYYPEEIAAVCLSKRFGVDLGLRHARQELRAHLADPHKIQELGRAPILKPKQPNFAIPVDDFESELRRNIFSSTNETCPSMEKLERCYSSFNLRSLECDLLAHIVTCESCLDKVARRCDVPPPPARSMEDIFGRASRGKSNRTGLSEQKKLARAFTNAKNRMREILEHHPTGLVIALNGEVAAVRDINSACAILRVETRAVQTLEIVEVFSEQGLLLLALPLLNHPPKSPPEIKHEVALGGERTLSLVVRYTGDGALIETKYVDPHFTSDTAVERECIAEYESMIHLGINMNHLDSESSARNPQPAQRSSLWRRFLDKKRTRLMVVGLLVPITAVALVIATLIVPMAINRYGQRIDANHLLSKATREDRTLSDAGQPVVIHQRIQIKIAGHIVQRDLYRDVRGIRQPKGHPMDADEQALRKKLSDAKLDWDNPLSAQNYQEWRDNLYREEDRIAKTGDNLLTITTNSQQSAIAQETITIKADSLHPVARTILFRDGESIEIAELSYNVLPWGPGIEQWFEPLSDSSSSLRSPMQKSHIVPPTQLDESQLDLAELNVLLVLQELHADTERLQVVRTPSSVLVKGVVESNDRKAELITHLQMADHVIADISSYQDYDVGGVLGGGVSQFKEVSITANDTPMKRQCKQKSISLEQCRKISYALLNSSALIVRESKRLSELQREYPSSKPLTLTARILLSEITQKYMAHINAALNEQERVIRSFDIERVRQTATTPSDALSLNDMAQQNLALSKELVYVVEERSRHAPVILQELAESDESVRNSLSLAAVDLRNRSTLSSTNSSPDK